MCLLVGVWLLLRFVVFDLFVAVDDLIFLRF